MWTTTEITRLLRIRYPLIQGPLGVGLSPPALVAAVSNAGGLGSCGANAMTPEQISDAADTIRQRTDRPFALNLWVNPPEEPSPDWTRVERTLDRLAPYYRELGIERPQRPARFVQDFAKQVESVIAARPAVFSFVFGIPPRESLAECRRHGIVTIGTATTVKEARALEDAGVDAITATGCEAGGMHCAFGATHDDSPIGTMALLPQVVDAVGVPVIAAGGIADGRGVAAALMLGACAVQCGTAFLACDESGAPAIHREALFAAAARTTTVTSVFNGRPARVIRNRFVDEMAAHAGELPPFPVQAWLTGSLRPAAIAQGRGELIAMQASQCAALLRHRKAAPLVEALVRQTSALLAPPTPPV